MTMVRKSVVAIGIVALGALALGAGIWLGRGPLHVAQAAAPAPATAKSVAALGIVIVDEAAQSRSGIATAELAAATYRPESTAYGVVMDLQPLLDLRARHASAVAEAAAASAAARASRAEYDRDRALHGDDRNVSLKVLEGAEAAYRVDQAKVDATAAALREVGTAARQQFGETLERWAFDPASARFAKLLSRDAVLVRVTLPGDAAVKAANEIHVDAPGYPHTTARLISRSPQSDPSLQGASYLYTAAAPLPAGTRLVARLPVAARPMQGLVVPDSAVIWYGDQSWVFVQESARRFVRRLVHGRRMDNAGLFVTGDIKPEERVVVRGAQLLHSEEQRPKSAADSGCKDPECD